MSPTTSQWEQHEFESVVLEILKKVAAKQADHHLGAPFLTAYQLAIEFERLRPGVAAKLGLQIGGKGIGEHNSLAQYVARELSQRIKHPAKIDCIEGAFLSGLQVESLLFTPTVESSTPNLSMFRWVPKSG